MSDSSASTNQAAVWRLMTIFLCGLCVLLAGIVFYFVARDREESAEAVVSVIDVHRPEETGINVGQIIDTMTNPDVEAREGHRYKVLVVDNARDGASGIARIGGLVTFVQGARRGDVAIIEITRRRSTSASAVLVERLESDHPVPDRPRLLADAGPSERDLPVSVGQEYEVMVTEQDRRNPERDGVARIEGLVVFIPNTQPGDRVRIRIVEELRRSARAELLERLEDPDT